MAITIVAMKAPFKFSARTRVGFSDTDAQGIVYYGRYLPYIDVARVEYHRKLGVLGMEIGEPGVEFVVRAARSSTTRRRCSTTSSRSSSASRASDARARRTNSPPIACATTC